MRTLQAGFALVAVFAFACPGWAWEIPGTDIFNCYNNTEEMPVCPSPGEDFYGQNGTYKKLHLYHDDGNGIVRDLVTELSWQKIVDNTPRDWNESGTICADLILGEHDDWRIPTIRELMTIVDNGKATAPKFNDVFEGDYSSYYWSSTTVAPENSGGAWTVDFGEGDTQSAPKTGTNIVRCVRGGPLQASVFVDNLDGTVTDQTTNVRWEKTSSPAAMTWKDALRYCENQTTGGHTGWRMPNIQELNTLVDFPGLFLNLPLILYFKSPQTPLNPLGQIRPSWVILATHGTSPSTTAGHVRFHQDKFHAGALYAGRGRPAAANHRAFRTFAAPLRGGLPEKYGREPPRRGDANLQGAAGWVQ